MYIIRCIYSKLILLTVKSAILFKLLKFLRLVSLILILLQIINPFFMIYILNDITIFNQYV